MELRVFEKPHRFVLKIPEQVELVHEVWIEGEAGRQHQLQKPALAQSENTLASYSGPAKHNDLTIVARFEFGTLATTPTSGCVKVIEPLGAVHSAIRWAKVK